WRNQRPGFASPSGTTDPVPWRSRDLLVEDRRARPELGGHGAAPGYRAMLSEPPPGCKRAGERGLSAQHDAGRTRPPTQSSGGRGALLEPPDSRPKADLRG